MTTVRQPNCRVDSSSAGREAFARYIKAFNEQDTDTFTAFYADDIQLKLGTGLLQRPEGVAAFYRKMYERVTERLEIHQTVIDDAGIAIEITATLRISRSCRSRRVTRFGGA